MNPLTVSLPVGLLSHKKMATPSSCTSRRLVQYVVVRSDLIHTLSWPLGAVITQACHAATAAIHLHYSDPDTQQYLAELDSMHKVVLQVSTAITSHAPCASVPGLQCWVGLYSSLRFLMFEKNAIKAISRLTSDKLRRFFYLLN